MLLSIVVNLLSSVNDTLQSASQAASPLILLWSDPALMIPLAMALCLSVCLSVRPSQVGILLKRLNVRSHEQHHTIVQEL